MLVLIDRVPLEPHAAEKVPLISLAVNSKVLKLQCNLQMGRISFRDRKSVGSTSRQKRQKWGVHYDVPWGEGMMRLMHSGLAAQQRRRDLGKGHCHFLSAGPPAATQYDTGTHLGMARACYLISGEITLDPR